MLLYCCQNHKSIIFLNAQSKFCIQIKQKKNKTKYAISFVDTLINSSDKSSIKTDLSQIWKLSGLSKNEFDALFIKNKGVDVYQYCRDTDTDCKC